MTKQAKEIARLKKRVLKLEKTLENNESKSKSSESTEFDKPVKKGAIIVSEYKDAFLITGSGTYNIKDILKRIFSTLEQ